MGYLSDGVSLTELQFTSEESTWEGHVSEKFNVGIVANGGYCSAFVLNAAMKHLQRSNSKHVDPLVMNCYFIGSCTSNQVCKLIVKVLKFGNLTTLVSSELEQGNKAKVVSTILFGIHKDSTELVEYLNPASRSSLDRLETRVEKLVSKDKVLSEEMDNKSGFKRPVFDRYDTLHQPDEVAATRRMHGENVALDSKHRADDTPSGFLPEYTVLSRLSDGESFSELALVALADSNVPCVKVIPVKQNTAWVPTLQWTLHFIAKVPKDIPWVACRFSTYAAGHGFEVEDCEISNPDTSELYLVSRQHAMMSVSQRKKSAKL